MFQHASKKDQAKKDQKDKSTANNTGIPLQMKDEFEKFSGFTLDNVRVHYNSDKPAELSALAYTQGSHVFVGPGQEQHLRHELGHVVQQKAGMVKPTGYIDGIAINNDEILEKQANGPQPIQQYSNSNVIQAFSIEWAKSTPPGNETIETVVLDRPSNLLSETALSRAGLSTSHTTAFVVIRRNLELRLVGKTYGNALLEIQQLTNEITGLPGYQDLDDKVAVDNKIGEINAGILELSTSPALSTKINRDILISGYASKYFLCRDLIKYTYNLAEYGGGAANEGGLIMHLAEAKNFNEAWGISERLLDLKDYDDDNLYESRARQQHYLAMASFFDGIRKIEIANAFRDPTKTANKEAGVISSTPHHKRTRKELPRSAKKSRTNSPPSPTEPEGV